MSTQDFEGVTAVLPEVEAAVLDAHRSLAEKEGRKWSRPVAYQWLRYEDPLPVERLREGVEKLRESGAPFDPAAVDKACAKAANRGFSI